MRRTLLVDLGGTRLKAGLAGSPDVLAAEHGGDWLAALRAVVGQLAADDLALCVPGIVDGGIVTTLPGKLPGIAGADLQALLEVPVPVVVNDAIAYGVGEATAGAGRGDTRVVVVTLGTGVGVAVVEEGRPLGKGPLGGGLLGGQLVIGTGGVDTSGRGGTFEALCSASALVDAVPGAGDVGAAYDALAAGDPAAVQGFSAFRSCLVQGLTALSLAHAPSCVVVGGGAAQPGLLDGVEQALAGGLWAGQSVTVRAGELGDRAALAGLAALLPARVPA